MFSGSPPEPIAIVGVGLRFPGSATFASFAANLLGQRCFIRELPAGFLTAEPPAGALAALLDDFDEDYEFLSLPPATLRGMSPSQRLALLCARDALHDTGFEQGRLDRHRTGVMVAACAGCEEDDAQTVSLAETLLLGRLRELAGEGERELLEELLGRYRGRYPEHPVTAESLPGRAAHMVAGRVAWAFDLHGPNLTIDAACASSLAALDCAVNSLRLRQCDAVLAGGVETWSTSEAFTMFGRLTALSSGGSFPFDARSDGFVLGEGCGLVLLKRQSDAERDGDRVYGLIHAVGAASDGAGPSVTAPQTAGQLRAIERAYQQAGLSPDDTGYVECHGTGTPVGDPVELATMDRFFARGVDHPLTLGSVKAALGHARTAAGMAGLFSALVALNGDVLPGLVNFATPSPALRSVEGRLRVALVTERAPQPVLQAGVSSFGFGGTNFHLLLRAANPRARAHLVDTPAVDSGRLPSPRSDLAFLFPGQGSQYPGMMEGLRRRPHLAPLFELAERTVRQLGGGSLLAALSADPADPELRQTALAQPALLTVSAALLQEARALGLEPGMALGHSVGEYAALLAAGAFDFEAALRAVAYRGRLMAEGGPAEESALLALMGPQDRLRQAMEKFAGRLVLANRNSYEQIVVAVDLPTLAEVRAGAERWGLRCHRLAVDRAFHSPYVKHAVGPMREHLERLSLKLPRLPVPSNAEPGFHPWGAEGSLSAQQQARVCELLSQQIAKPVDFVSQVELAYASGIRRFVELGPGDVLTRLVEQILQGKAFQALALDSGRDGGWERSLQALPARLSEPLLFQRRPSPYCRRRKVPSASRALPVEGLSAEETVRAVVAEVTGYPPERLGREVDFVSELGLDSLKLVEIVARLRGRVLAADHHGFRQLTSIARILAAAPPDLAASRPRAGAARCYELRPRRTFPLILGRPEPPEALWITPLPACWRETQELLPELWRRLMGCPPGGRFALLTHAPERERSSFLALAAFLRSAARDLPEITITYHHLRENREEVVEEALARDGLGLWRADDGSWWQEAHLALEAPDPKTSLPLTADDLVLVTGGARGIAACCVAALLEACPSRFLLLGRQPEGPQGIPERHRDRVEYLRCDLSDARDVARARLGERGVTLLIHAAGVASLTPFRQLDAENLAPTFEGKVAGLERLLQELELDKLRGAVMFSSIAAYFGPPAQADYAAANAMLDGFRAGGLPVLSLQWTAWGEVGMLARPQLQGLLETTGLETLPPQEGVALFRSLLAAWLSLPEQHSRVVAVTRAVPDELERGSPGLGEPSLASPTALEQGTLFLESSYPLAQGHLVAWSDRLSGPLDPALPRQALQAVLNAHPALRASYQVNPRGEVERRIVDGLEVECPLLEVATSEELSQRIEELRSVPFPLDSPPLLRAALLGLGEQDHTLLVVAHHIAVDGAATRALRRHLFQALELLGQGRAARPRVVARPPRPDLTLARQTELLHSWLREGHPVGGEPPPAASDLSFANAHLEVEIGAARWRLLRQAVEQSGATTFSFLCAAFCLARSRLDGVGKVSFGVALEGRRPEERECAGLYANILPVEISLPDKLDAPALVERCREGIFRAIEHQELPFPTLVQALAPPRRPGVAPLFTEVLEYQQVDDATISGSWRDFRSYPPVAQLYDLVLSFRQWPERLQGRLSLRPTRLSYECGKALIGAFLESLDDLLGGAPAVEPAPHPSSHQAAFSAALELSIAEAFDARVSHHGDAPALELDGAVTSYRQLQERSLQAAAALQRHGVGPGDRVLLCLPREPDTVALMLGLCRLGATFAPLDTAEPAARQRELSRSLAPRLVLAREWFEQGPHRLSPESLFAEQARHLQDKPAGLGRAVAALMLTSGSSGHPKAVRIAQSSIVSLARGLPLLELGPGKRVLAASSLAFDASFFEIWGALLQGATVVLHNEPRLTLHGLAVTLRRGRVSTAWLTSSLFNLFLDELPGALSGLQDLVVGGEVVSLSHLRRAREQYPGLRLFNGYGPTECTTFATMHEVSAADLSRGLPVPIGRPLPHVALRVVEDNLCPVAAGCEGEILIGGGGVALGYFQEEDSPAFWTDPRDGSRWYRSGDRGHMEADGTVRYLGRRDRQLKIRGYRVEPEEVETHLLALEGVRRAAVTGQSEGQSTILVAYLVCSDKTLTVDAIRRRLAQRLPDFMVPAAILFLPELPLTANGKLDWRALPRHEARSPTSRYRLLLPRDPLEGLVCAVWEDALKVRLISVNDDFGELGGHSLAALTIVARLESLLGKRLPVSSLFFASTVEKMAALLREEGWKAHWQTVVPMSQGSGPVFHCVHPADGNVFCYRELVRALGGQVRFHALQARGLDGVDEPHTTVEEMAAFYVEAITCQPTAGPYLLGGWSSGGAVAYEMARQLTERGHPVAAVILLDSFFPLGSYEPAERVRQELSKTVRDIERVGGDALRYSARVLTARAPLEMDTVRHVVRLAGKVLLSRVGLAQRHVYESRPADQKPTHVALAWRALDLYRAPRATFRTVLLQATDNELEGSFDGRLAWRRVAPELEVVPVAGDHYSLLESPHCQEVARAVLAVIGSERPGEPRRPELPEKVL